MHSSSGSSTVTIITGESSLSNSQRLSSSAPAPSSNRRPSSEISKAYKLASQLFLTRRFPEALSVLEPIITPTKLANGYAETDEDSLPEASIANATTTQRIKIWVLYLTLLNSIVDLGEYEGSRSFGQIRYREMVARVRNGEIWETVVRDGYGGREGSLDSEVVYNLANLLLGHAPSQAVTQSRMESYFASSSHADLDNTPTLNHDLSNQLGPLANGAETPKDLTSRLKILELFTLHVLPRNEEWEYARSFISMSDMLDDERRDAFLQSFQELKDVRDHELREKEEALLQLQKDAQLPKKLEGKKMAEADPSVPMTQIPGQNGSVHRRRSSEVDYGIDQNRPTGNTVPGPAAQRATATPNSTSAPSGPRARHPRSAEGSSNRNVRRSPQKQIPAFVRQISNVFRVLQNVVQHMTASLRANPTVLLRMLLSLIAIIMALSRRDIRERAKRILNSGWEKVRSTVGMGVKVSYI